MMKKIISLIVLVLATLLIAFYFFNINKQNENNSPSLDELQTNYLEGYIQKIGSTTFLVNDSKTVLQSTTIFIETELIEGNNYKVMYQLLLESDPPKAEIVDYEQIEENYCS